MRKALRASLTLLVLAAMTAVSAPHALAGGGRNSLATITGTVRDSRGNAVAGAVISLLREGANEVVKQTRSTADGSFATRVAPGRYNLRAVASGFNDALFTAVQVYPSDELIYRFNLEPAGQGRTAPERRRDRNDPRYRLRGAQARRSIFQMQEGEDNQVALGEDVGDADYPDIVPVRTLDDDLVARSQGDERAHHRRGRNLRRNFKHNGFSPGRRHELRRLAPFEQNG